MTSSPCHKCRSSRAGPSADARYRYKEGEWGKGARGAGGRARAWKVNHAGRYMGVGTEVGILTSVAMQLVVVLQISKRLGLEVGVEIRRPEAGAGSQSRIAKGMDFS